MDSTYRLLVLAAMTSVVTSLAVARDFVVAANGSDNNPGTVGAPLRTIGRAASRMGPGDTCYVRAGTYRESIQRLRRVQCG